MKVLDLRCAHDHRFEGWFASDEDEASQRERGLLACPMCGDGDVQRLPSAPRLNLASARAAGGADAATTTMALPAPDDPQAQWLRAMRKVMANTEDVGERFPEEARRIHYGEVPARGIRGRASPDDAKALADEGIEVMALPLPDALKGPVQWSRSRARSRPRSSTREIENEMRDARAHHAVGCGAFGSQANANAPAASSTAIVSSTVA